MDSKTEHTSLHLKENLKGRIENLAMAPSYANTLIPVFEAIMNSIHAVQDRYADDWAEKGEIRVTVLRSLGSKASKDSPASASSRFGAGLLTRMYWGGLNLSWL